MRQLNLNELLEKIDDYSSDVEYADIATYNSTLWQFFNFLNNQPIALNAFEKIENDYVGLVELLEIDHQNKKEVFRKLEEPLTQGVFGYLIIKRYFGKDNKRFQSVFKLAKEWYGPRKTYHESKDDFNEKFFIPFVKTLRWYLEESESYNSKDFFSQKEVEHFEEKLDEINEMFSTLKNGQEIIFDEIEDLKEQLLNSKKKNWLEMFKGKFYDFVFDKTISGETFQLMYQTLTGDKKNELNEFIQSLTQ